MKSPAPRFTSAAEARPWATALRELLAERWDRYRSELKVGRRRFSPESVHESRVAARRLRAALDLLAAATGSHGLGKARRALKRHLKLFAALRDVQVQRALLPALRFPRNIGVEFDKLLRRRELAAARRAQRGLAQLKTRSLAKAIARLDRGLRQRKSVVGEPQLLALVECRFRQVGELRARVDVREPETIHRTRVAFKRFRYSVEMLAPLLPRLTPPRIAALRRHQALMAAVQDACVSLDWFAHFAAHAEFPPATLQRVRQKLVARCDRAIGRYLRHADALPTFWPLCSAAVNSLPNKRTRP
jgi:CHAD domain-containing protein